MNAFCIESPAPVRLGEKEAARWRRLAIIWALYYLISWTVGQNVQTVQKIIWGGAALVGAASIPVFVRNRVWQNLPAEGICLCLFSAWTATGFFIAQNDAMFWLQFRQVAELALIVLFVSIVLRHSAGAGWFFGAFLLVSTIKVALGNEPMSLAQLQVETRIASANTLGFHCYMGLVGMFGLWGKTERLWARIPLLSGGLIAMYGVVLSASRGALVVTMVLVVLWVLFCQVASSRVKMAGILGAVLILYGGHVLFRFVIRDTYMGKRFMQSTQLEDSSSRTRLELFNTGWDMFLSRPLFGCGIGQFGSASGLGYNTHNEMVEIAATTGLPGLVLYYSAFLMAWRRLTRSIRRLGQPEDRYQINVARIALLTLFISGAIFRPNFLSQNSMFMLGVVAGVAQWAEAKARTALWCQPGLEPSNQPAFGVLPAGEPWPTPRFRAAGFSEPPPQSPSVSRPASPC